jgi:trimeric autotransporter adhesin
MSSKNQKLRLFGALAALTTLALAISCRGFFTNPTVNSIVISPTNPTVPLGGTLQMHAFGTNDDGSSAGDITSKVLWSSDNASISVSTGGLLTGVALSATAANISASYQLASPQSTTANVCVEGGTNFQILPKNATVAQNTAFPGGGYTASIDISTGTLDVTTAAQWSVTPTGVTITGGVDPAEVDTSGVVTVPQTFVVTGSYTCNGVVTSISTNLTVD